MYKQIKSICDSQEEREIAFNILHNLSGCLKFVRDGKIDKDIDGNFEEFLDSEENGIGLYLHRNIADYAVEALGSKNMTNIFQYLTKKGLSLQDYKPNPTKFTVDFVFYLKKNGIISKIFLEYSPSYHHSLGDTPIRDALKAYSLKDELFYVIDESYNVDKFLENTIYPMLQ